MHNTVTPTRPTCPDHDRSDRDPRAPTLRRLGLAASTVLVIAAVAAPGLATDYAWTEGYYSATTLPANLGPGDNLFISGGPKVLDVTLTSAGNIYWSSGDVPCSGGHLVNNGTVWMGADGRWGYGGGPAGSFTNYGTVVKTGGAGSTEFYSANLFVDEFTFVNAGTLEVLSGAIEYSSPITRFLAGTVFAGPGQHLVSSVDARFEGPFTVETDADVRLEGDNLTSTTNSTTFNGTLTFVSGFMHGPWTIPSGSTLAVVGGGVKRFDDADVTCAGTVTLADTLYVAGGTTVVNDGVFDFLGDHVVVYGGGNGCVFDNLATGTLRKSGGLASGGIGWGNQGWDELLFYNWGTLDAQVGTLEYPNPGTHFLDGTVLTGAGSHRVTMSSVTFEGDVTAEAPVVLDAGGPLTGEAAVLHGTFELASGDLVNTWTLAADGVLDVTGSGGKRLSGGTFTNEGTINLQAGLPLSAMTLVNQGLIDVQGPFTLAYGGGDWPALANQGEIRVSGGGASGIGYQVGFTNQATGTVDVQTGTFTCDSHSFSSNGGTLRVAGGATFVSPGALTNLGTITGAGTLQLPSLVNQGVVSPGASVGTLTVTGAFSQSAVGGLELQLGGTTPGTNHDQLIVGGGSSFGGALHATLAGGFVPTAGDVFVVISGTTSGTFDTLELPAVAGRDWQLDHSPLTLTLVERAGLVFADGFESGDILQWSQSTGGAKVGTLRFGDDPEWFRLSLELDPTQRLAAAEAVAFVGDPGRTAPRLTVERRQVADAVELRVVARAADGARRSSPWSSPVPVGSLVELHWAAAAPGAADGALHVYGEMGLLAAIFGLTESPGAARTLLLFDLGPVDLVAPACATYEAPDRAPGSSPETSTCPGAAAGTS